MPIARPSSKQIKEWVELTKGVLEILAIVAAGAWAYSKYVEADKPQLQPRMSASSSLTWYKGNVKDTCLASFSVHIKNIGKIPTAVTSARLRMWLIEDKDGGDTSFLDPKILTINSPAFDKQLTERSDSSLISNYPIEIEQQEDFTFKQKKVAGKIALFSLSAETTGGSVEESRWSYLCDLP